MKTSTSASLAVLALIAACTQAPPPSPAQPDATAIKAALTAVMDQMPALMEKKDATTAAGLFTEDATWILPDASTFVGRADIEKGTKAFFASGESIKLNAMILDKLVVISDTEALTFSHGTYSMVVKGKKPENRVNPIADYWKKGADGVWRIAYEVNADGPAPVAPPAAAKTP